MVAMNVNFSAISNARGTHSSPTCPFAHARHTIVCAIVNVMPSGTAGYFFRKGVMTMSEIITFLQFFTIILLLIFFNKVDLTDGRSSIGIRNGPLLHVYQPSPVPTGNRLTGIIPQLTPTPTCPFMSNGSRNVGNSE